MSNQRIIQRLDYGVQYPQAVDIVALAGQMNAQFLNVNQQLDNVGQQLDRLAAQTSNGRILTFNRLLPVGLNYRPPVKEVSGHTHQPSILQSEIDTPHQIPGSGMALAVQLTPPGIHFPQQLVVLQANAVAGNPAPPVALGQAPPFYNADLDAYQHGDVLRLIEFYNDTFGIVLADVLATRKQKVRIWMTL